MNFSDALNELKKGKTIRLALDEFVSYKLINGKPYLITQYCPDDEPEIKELKVYDYDLWFGHLLRNDWEVVH